LQLFRVSRGVRLCDNQQKLIIVMMSNAKHLLFSRYYEDEFLRLRLRMTFSQSLASAITELRDAASLFVGRISGQIRGGLANVSSALHIFDGFGAMQLRPYQLPQMWQVSHCARWRHSMKTSGAIGLHDDLVRN
jgi:hypothetical protein